MYSREWTGFSLYDSKFTLIDNDVDDDYELHEKLIDYEESEMNGSVEGLVEKKCCFVNVLEREKLTMLGEEHTIRLLIRRWDFWLYYMAYFCGGTIGLVYSNNLGQISQSLGHRSQINSLVTLYSTCSFFGRLLAAAPDFLSRYSDILALNFDRVYSNLESRHHFLAYCSLWPTSEQDNTSKTDVIT